MTSLPCLCLCPPHISWLHILFRAYPHRSRLRWHLDRPVLFRENCWHAHGLITLSSSETCFPSSNCLFHSPVSLSVCAHVCFPAHLFSLVMHLSLLVLCFTFEVYLHLYLPPRPPICFPFGALVFLPFPRSVVTRVLTLDIRWCSRADSSFLSIAAHCK